jgi:hypothetical protein
MRLRKSVLNSFVRKKDQELYLGLVNEKSFQSPKGKVTHSREKSV